MICSNCGFETAGSEKFCPRCGAVLSVEEAVGSQPVRFSASLRPHDSTVDAGQWSRAAGFDDFGFNFPSRETDRPAGAPAASYTSIPSSTDSGAIRYCHMCGTPLFGAAAFCPNCGAPTKSGKAVRNTRPSTPGIGLASTSEKTVKILSIVTASISLLLVILWFCNFVSVSMIGYPIGGLSAHEMLGEYNMGKDGLKVTATGYGLVITVLSVLLLLASSAVSLLPNLLKRPNRRWMFVLQVVHASCFMWWLLLLTSFALEKHYFDLTFGAILMILLGIAQIVLICVTRSKSKKLYTPLR